MSRHDVHVMGFTERQGDRFTQRPDSTLGLIEVRPPIRIGQKFGAVVLGRNPYGVSLEEAVSTEDVTLLVAEAGTYGSDQDKRQRLIRSIGTRVEEFVNHPQRAVSMLREDPFPQPEER